MVPKVTRTSPLMWLPLQHLEPLSEGLHPCFKPLNGPDPDLFPLAVSGISSGLLVFPVRQGVCLGPSLDASVQTLGRTPHSNSILVP